MDLSIQKQLKPAWIKLNQVMSDTFKHIQESQLPMTASSLAYTTILSVIPLLAVSFSIFKAFGGMDQLFAIIEPLVLQNLAQGSGDDVVKNIRQFIGNIHAGTLGASGFVGLIITSMSLLFSIEKTVNKLWNTGVERHWFNRVAIYWLIITVGPLALSLLIGYATSHVSEIGNYLPSGTGIFFIFFGFFTALNKWIPNRRVHWIPATTAGFVTALVWVLAKAGYGWYNQKVITYNKIYGSLGAIPIFLVWIYVCWLVTLAGSAFAAVMQKRLDLR